jgi:hypothetical protein
MTQWIVKECRNSSRIEKSAMRNSGTLGRNTMSELRPITFAVFHLMRILFCLF